MMYRLLWVVLLLACQMGGVQAAEGGPQVVLQAFRVATGLAGERLEPFAGIRPGDTIEYQATYHAEGAVRGVQVTLPIPAGGLAYIGDGAPDQASLDGRRFEAVPLMRAETLPDGRVQMRRVPLSEYRYLRWSLGDLPAGAERRVHARVHLEGLDSTPVPLAAAVLK